MTISAHRHRLEKSHLGNHYQKAARGLFCSDGTSLPQNALLGSKKKKRAPSEIAASSAPSIVGCTALGGRSNSGCSFKERRERREIEEKGSK